MKLTIVLGIVIAALACIGWAMLHRSTQIGSPAFIAVTAPTPTPTPIPEPSGSADPLLCSSNDYDSGWLFGSKIRKEMTEADKALKARQFKVAVDLARDAETRMNMCVAQAGVADNPQADLELAKIQLTEAEAYIGAGDGRGSATLGEAEATVESAAHSIDADANTKRMAHEVSEQIARDLANLEQ